MTMCIDEARHQDMIGQLISFGVAVVDVADGTILVMRLLLTMTA